VTLSISDTEHNNALHVLIAIMLGDAVFCNAEYLHAECYYNNCHYAECYYAECHYPECRSAIPSCM
jgi:hypothetical protein